jgi:hypothetical protein
MHRWENIIKVVLEIGQGSVDGIQLAKYRDQ